MVMKKMVLKLFIATVFFAISGSTFLIGMDNSVSYKGEVDFIRGSLAFELGSVNLKDPWAISQTLFVLRRAEGFIDREVGMAATTKKKIEKAVAAIKNALEQMQKISSKEKRKQVAQVQLQKLMSVQKSMHRGVFDVFKTPTEIKEALDIALESFISNLKNVA